MADPALEPTHVDVDKEHGVTITWADGATTRYDLADLRLACPCAECRGLRERGLPVWPKPGSSEPLTVAGAEWIGNWGIAFEWNDGHRTGIYSFELLRGD